MAEGKKSATIYCDLIHTVEELKDSDAGKLFKHYLRYINDQEPEPPSQLIKIVFEPIKQQLKRDLKKWEAKSKKNSESAAIRWANKMPTDANASERIKPDAKHADTVTVTDKDTVTDINYLIKIGMETFLKKPSEILLNEYKAVLDTCMMHECKGIKQETLLAAFDSKYATYEFRDRNHLINSVNKVGKDILNPPKNNNQEQGTKLTGKALPR